ncbi:MAG: glycosyltransferase, partial [Mucilaginibacter sp.]
DSLDLYLHPSKHEGLPRAVIEAMSRACPVLASTIAGTPELLPAKYLHEPGDYKKLAGQIKDTLNNKELLCAMALENFNHSKAYTYTEIKSKKSNFWKKYKDNVIVKK